MSKTAKKAVIDKHQTHGKDTGSAPVQIAIMTTRILELTEHLKTHKKDKSSRKGLLGLVSRRRKLMNYLKLNQPKTHAQVAKKHNLK